MAVRFILKGPLDTELVQRAFNEIVRRHEVLRTVFALEDGKPVQIISTRFSMEVPVTDLRTIPESKRMAEVDRLGSMSTEEF